MVALRSVEISYEQQSQLARLLHYEFAEMVL
jgi:hypothetical protein